MTPRMFDIIVSFPIMIVKEIPSSHKKEYRAVLSQRPA